jgi:photosystem II stability/assembly factor-like uncharacterized protein
VGRPVQSDDGAASWQALPRFRASQFVAVAPSAPNVLYAEDNGLFRSLDFGTTWARVWPDDGFYDAFAIDPRDANTIYFGLRTEGLWKSTDGGRNARLLMATHGLQNITEIAIDPRNPQQLIAGGDWGAVWGLFRTTDGGEHWKRISRGLPRLDSIRDLEVSPASGAPILAGFFAGGVFRTTSGGGSWRPTNRGLAATPVRALVLDPGSPSIVYAGLDDSSGVARSTNGGRRWSRSGLRARNVFALAAARQTIFAGTTRGVIYRTRKGGSTWHKLLSKPGDAVVALATAPSAPRVIYGAFYKAGIYRSADGGDTWRSAGALAQVQTLAVQPNRPNRVFAGWAGTVARSRNGGRTWKRSADPVGAVKAFAVDPARPNILYAAVEAGSAPGGVYKSVDGGANWVRTVTGITTKDLSAIAIDRHRPTTIYSGGCGTTPPGGVYRSTDAARTWTKISTGMTTTCVTSIALTPSGRTLHVGILGGGVFTKKVR